MTWEQEHIGRRVVYTGRNGNTRFGTLKDIVELGTSQMLDLRLDGSTREHFFVPSDTIKLVPDAAASSLPSSVE